MNRRNWLDLSRKLVDRYDLDFTVAAAAAALGQQELFRDGKGVKNTLAYLNSLYVLLSGAAMSITVKSGLAYDPNGQPIIVAADQNVAITSDPTNPKWSLLCLQYVQTGDTPVPKPSDPITTIDLNLHDDFILVLRDGTPNVAPAYPATQPGDIILRGIKIPAGATLASQCSVDFSVADFITMAVDTFDNRLLPMAVDVDLVAVKPSQTFGQSPQKFTFIGKNQPSIFPKDGTGAFNPNDTLLNFQTGAISGGDAASPAFAPTIPGAGQSIVATVALKPNNTLLVSYGTAGTSAQCLAAIQNQTYAGAGSLAAVSPFFKIAYVVVSSTDGVNVSAVKVIDARNFGGYQVGSGEYDAITGTGPNATHPTIAAALADLNASKKKILVGGSEVLNAPIVISQDDTTLEFLPGVTLSNGTAATGIHVQANGFRCRNGRMTGFTDAVLIDAAKNYAMITGMRWNGNTSDVTDNSTTALEQMNITE